MENSNNKPKKTKRLAIAATILEPYLFQNFVEQLADLHYEIEYNKKHFQDGWQTIDTSSVEAHVKIGVDFKKVAPSSATYVTIFLFTCIREKGGQFKLCWSHSLS
jgi:hypothetical protein